MSIIVDARRQFRRFTAISGCLLAAALCMPLSALSGQTQSAKTAKPSASGASSDMLSSILPTGEKPRLLIDGAIEKPGLTMSEGPAWIHGRLYFSNYYMFWKKFGTSDEGGLCVYEPGGTWRVLNRDVQTCGADPLHNGNLAVCDLIHRCIIEMTPEGKVVGTLADSFNGIPFGMPNDVIVDAQGGIYFTDPVITSKGPKQPVKGVYYRAPGGKVVRAAEYPEDSFPNGMALSPDRKTLYLNDSWSTAIHRFDVLGDGSLANRRLFAELALAEGRRIAGKKTTNADGMTVDSSGNLYVATDTGIQVFDSSGKRLGVIRFPSVPSNCKFGGKDLSILYVTGGKRLYSVQTKQRGIEYPLK
jgi:gluconolactonase